MKSRNIRTWAVIFSLILAALPLGAQTQQNLHSFTNKPDGSAPYDMIFTNGMLFGSCHNGGTSNNGTLYYLGTNGNTYVTLHNFGGAPFDGGLPNNIIVGGGTIYGTTYGGSTNSSSFGTIFKIGTNGLNYTILRNFTNAPDGSSALSGLVLVGTNLYGTTSAGGTNGCGIVFRIATNGASYTVLHTFTNTPDGNSPQAGLTLLGTNLFGTTASGGLYGVGTIFQLSTNGATYSIIHHFTNNPDGADPMAAMLVVSNVLYGTTFHGGTNGDGTIFSITTNGLTYSVLTHFSGFSTPATNNHGTFNYSPLIFANGWLYGGAYLGGLNSAGDIFQIRTNGTNFTILKSFSDMPDGASPHGTLTLVSSNLLYGTTESGGTFGYGLAFGLSLFPPVISQQPQNVSVTNGYPATFNALATGVGNLNYQWYYRTNAAITNAINPTLTITNITTNNIGTYNIIVTNTYGSVTSSYASLSVISTPVLLNYGYDKTSGNFTMALAYTPTLTNRIWATTNLITNFWKVVATNKMGTNGLWFFTEPSIGKTNQVRFYRYSTP